MVSPIFFLGLYHRDPRIRIPECTEHFFVNVTYGFLDRAQRIAQASVVVMASFIPLVKRPLVS
jgi:hypothetical protein